MVIMSVNSACSQFCIYIILPSVGIFAEALLEGQGEKNP